MKCHLCDNHFEIETDPKVGLYIDATVKTLTYCILEARQLQYSCQGACDDYM